MEERQTMNREALERLLQTSEGALNISRFRIAGTPISAITLALFLLM
ncbi:MAG: hypothetical protein ACI8S6_005196, partial [Myxococcota bacterium]